MREPFFALTIYSIVIVLTAWAGASIPLIAKWRRRTIRLFISFGAGVLLGAAFLHMIPEAAELIQARLGIPLLLGFLSLYIAEKFVMVHSCEAEECDFHTVGWSAFWGLSLHSFITGIALASGMLATNLGFVVFLAILMHKFPASFSLASVLLHEEFPRRKIAAVVFVFSISVPIGAGITFLAFDSVSPQAVGWLVAFSAGTFLHVAADDLLPEVHSANLERKSSLSVFLAGIFVIWLTQQIAV